MWVEEDSSFTVALEENECWGSRVGVVMMRINELELIAHQE